jgi:hypothetical protein
MHVVENVSVDMTGLEGGVAFWIIYHPSSIFDLDRRALIVGA